jgi:hypothetical protein
MLQTPSSDGFSSSTLQFTFSELDIGDSYRLAFYLTAVEGSKRLQYFGVYNEKHETVSHGTPSQNTWQLQKSDVFTADTTTATFRFQAISNDQIVRALGITGVKLMRIGS